MRLINLTAHELHIRCSDGETLTISPGFAAGGPRPEFEPRDLGGGVTVHGPFPTLARCEQTSAPAGTIAVPYRRKAVYSDPDGAYPDVPGEHVIAVTRQRFGAVTGLPAPRPDTAYVVSRIVAEACRDRDDLLIPGPAIRDQAGRVVGCDGLSRL